MGQLPSLSPETEPFWKACDRGEFLLQRCRECGCVQYHYRAICANCWSAEVEDLPAAGTGTVWTFSVVLRGRGAGLEERIPFVVAVIALDEGVKVLANVVECDPAAVRIGAPVELAFALAPNGQAIPVFRLAEPG